MHDSTTFADNQVVPAQRSWASLRSLRADPPGQAHEKARRTTFTAALEQAEQLFKAAANVGVATKPLLCFYGLSQAGRALASAYVLGSQWQLSGHGIKQGEGSRGTGRNRLADLSVEPTSKDAFGTVADALRSSSLGPTATMARLWPLVAEMDRYQLPGALGCTPLPIYIDPAAWAGGVPTIEVSQIPTEKIGVEFPIQPINFYGGTYGAHVEAVDTFLATYPTLKQRRPLYYGGQPLGMSTLSPSSCSVRFLLDPELAQKYASPEEFYSSIAVLVQGVWRAYPAMNDGPRPVHPLMVWWAILYRLSMLCRYEPHTWDSMTDIDTSTDAVPIELLLEGALTTVPQLLVHALTGIRTGPTEEAAGPTEP